jgi:polyphosphate glucokinase
VSVQVEQAPTANNQEQTMSPRKPRVTATAGTTNTLTLDIGGTGLKASVLDSSGKMLHDRVRVETKYPCSPMQLIDALVELVAPLPAFARVSVGFPGVVRNGIVRTAPHLVTRGGAGTKVDPDMAKAWTGFDLDTALSQALAKPTRVINDADLQGLDASTGVGLEVVVTLGTGFGTAVVREGVLNAHLEISQHVFRHDETYDEQLGDVTRKAIGNRKWNKRVRLALQSLDTLLNYDHIYIGGGNAAHLKGDLGPKVSLIDPNAGILGGLKLWDQPEEHFLK